MAITFKAGAVEPPKEFFVKAGEYKLRIVEAKEDTSKAGNDMIVVTFRVLNPDGSDGPKFKENLVFTANAAWKINGFLKACGMHPGEGQDWQPDTDEMLGWECRASLRVVTGDKGGKFNEVSNFVFSEFD